MENFVCFTKGWYIITVIIDTSLSMTPRRGFIRNSCSFIQTSIAVARFEVEICYYLYTSDKIK